MYFAMFAVLAALVLIPLYLRHRSAHQHAHADAPWEQGADRDNERVSAEFYAISRRFGD